MRVELRPPSSTISALAASPLKQFVYHAFQQAEDRYLLRARRVSRTGISRTMVETMILLAHKLRLTACAEGCGVAGVLDFLDSVADRAQVLHPVGRCPAPRWSRAYGVSWQITLRASTLGLLRAPSASGNPREPLTSLRVDPALRCSRERERIGHAERQGPRRAVVLAPGES